MTCRCVDGDESLLANVSSSVLVRVANTLVDILAEIVDVNDCLSSVGDMKIASSAPWILLFTLIRS